MDPIDYPELAHSEFSPSSLKYYALCPSWCEGDSEQAGEDAAQRGTLIHKAFETGDLSALSNEIDIACAKKALAYVELIKRHRLAQLSGTERNQS
jgi:hypothetical protein